MIGISIVAEAHADALLDFIDAIESMSNSPEALQLLAAAHDTRNTTKEVV